jgi:hypothetical protein
MVRVDIDAVLKDIKEMNLLKTQLCADLGLSQSIFANAKRTGKMSCSSIKKICDMYFKHMPKTYQKWVAVHDLPTYENYMQLMNETLSSNEDSVPVDYDKMNAKLESMNLQFDSVCRIFDFSEGYKRDIKNTGLCNVDFLHKFCELTNTLEQDYIIKRETPEPPVNGVTDNAVKADPKVVDDIAERVADIYHTLGTSVDCVARVETTANNIDAGIIGVLKELQKMTKQLVLISKALGVEEEKK